MNSKTIRVMSITTLTTLVFVSAAITGKRARAVEIPLQSLSPVRIGYIDLQKVFDTYPEKSFAEGDLLKEVQKRRTELSSRQNSINVMRQQLAADQAAMEQAKAGKPVVVPQDQVAALEPVTPAAPEPQPEEVKKSTTAVANEPYPMDEPLAGLPGHSGETPSDKDKALPGMKKAPTPQAAASPLLDSLAQAGTPTTLTAEAQAALQKRIEATRLALDRQVYQFKDYRGKALEDMKHLQTEKTYGVMARIYAVLQGLARDENITVVLDKSYVLYGEETVDLSEKLIARLNQEQNP
jgi:Skp family chaperone for outer membrane proteins